MLYSALVTPTYGGYTDPGVYENHLTTSTNGILRSENRIPAF